MHVLKCKDILFTAVAFGIAQGYILVYGGMPARPYPTNEELLLLPAMITWFVGFCYMVCRMTTKDMPA